MRVIGMTGAKGAAFAHSCDLALVVPSEDVARIQEAHIACGHLICQLVEDALFGGQD
jgi:D-sedoheptulose 7-phosphate isomerase